jgi:hypothetical protein
MLSPGSPRRIERKLETALIDYGKQFPLLARTMLTATKTVINPAQPIPNGDKLNSKHRAFKKNFDTEMQVNGTKIPLNHFVQETVANIMIGLLKTLKEVKNEAPASIEIKIKKLPKQVEVDAHTYPQNTTL